MCSILGLVNFKDTTLGIAQEVLSEMGKTWLTEGQIKMVSLEIIMFVSRITDQQ